MTWQENLFSNLLVIFILLTLAVIIYCRVKGVTITELVKDIREAMNPDE